MFLCTLCPRAAPTKVCIVIDGVLHAICGPCAKKRERVRQAEIAERRKAEQEAA
jgi:ribosome-binding protein aMBF1 (putative translation factor)